MGNTSSIRVPVTTLDQLILRYGRPYYCKVDVEGYEVEVFRGLTQPIPMISFEIHAKEQANTETVLKILHTLDGDCTARLADAWVTKWLWPDWLPVGTAR